MNSPKRSYEFTDIDSYNPDTLPNKLLYPWLKPGEIVKVVCGFEAFEVDTAGGFEKISLLSPPEAFWVTLTEVDGDQLKGRVSSDLFTKDLKFGDIISFEKRHIREKLCPECEKEELVAMKKRVPKGQLRKFNTWAKDCQKEHAYLSLCISHLKKKQGIT